MARCRIRVSRGPSANSPTEPPPPAHKPRGGDPGGARRKAMLTAPRPAGRTREMRIVILRGRATALDGPVGRSDLNDGLARAQQSFATLKVVRL